MFVDFRVAKVLCDLLSLDTLKSSQELCLLPCERSIRTSASSL